RFAGCRRPALGDPAAGHLRHRGAYGRHVHRGGELMKLLIKGGRIVDPASGRDEAGDVFVSGGLVVNAFKEKPDKTIDAKGLVVAPGLIDLSARLREPGQEYKATLASEMDAAVAGGVT